MEATEAWNWSLLVTSPRQAGILFDIKCLTLLTAPVSIRLPYVVGHDFIWIGD